MHFYHINIVNFTILKPKINMVHIFRNFNQVCLISYFPMFSPKSSILHIAISVEIVLNKLLAIFTSLFPSLCLFLSIISSSKISHKSSTLPKFNIKM